MNFNGKTALITGAAVGIGRAVAHKMAEHGAKLVLIDMNAEKLEITRGELEKYGVEVDVHVCNVCDEQAVNAVAAQSGKIDILVNNAALWRNFSSFVDTPSEVWRSYLDVNIMGVVHCAKAVLPGMLERGYGRIINVGSVAGVYGNVNMVHYSTSKGALIAMTKALAKEVTAKGVLVNCVSPGSVSPAENPDYDFHQPSPLPFIGRTGTDMENANLICFLASDEASYISGQNIQIDGCRKMM